jgi:hypothetical protein
MAPLSRTPHLASGPMKNPTSDMTPNMTISIPICTLPPKRFKILRVIGKNQKIWILLLLAFLPNIPHQSLKKVTPFYTPNPRIKD